MRSYILISALLLFGALTAFSADAGSGGRFVVDYSANPSPEKLATYDLAIVDGEAEIDPRAVGDQTRVLCYLSIGEARRGGKLGVLAEEAGIDVAVRNTAWDSDVMDPGNPVWHGILWKEVQELLDRGFDGLFLDTLDSIDLLPEAAREAAWEAAVGLVADIRAAHPEIEIVVNRGFARSAELLPHVDGVLVESLFHSFRTEDQVFVDVAVSDSAWLVKEIEPFQDAGKAIYIIDYLPAEDAGRAEAALDRIEALGYSGFISTPDLQGTVVGALEEVHRSILVLFGSDPKLTEAPRVWASDCEVAGLLQMPLEWMGYRLHYHDVQKGRLPDGALENCAGIIVDPGTWFPQQDELFYADLICRCVDEEIKVLFAGGLTFRQEIPARKVLSRLRIGGAGDLVLAPQNVTATHVDDTVMNFERDLRPSALGFRDLLAPDEADVLLSLKCDNRYGVSHQFDPVFVAEWGGMLCNPYWKLQPSPTDILSYVDPFAFLSKIWPEDAFPVPDPTTRDGRRIFYAHIDGDGFTTLSRLQRGATCAELVRDRILKKYPFPTTVSIIESEIRAQLSTHAPEDVDKYEALAREIFAMPRVEAASHSYSHPFVWNPTEDVDSVRDYRELRLRFREEIDYPEIDLEREIKGSIDYINEVLLPPGKRVELMLWSGNCRPFAEAIRICREIGVENMNGGQTVISRRHPHLASVAPRVAEWEGELQIHTANQNDYVYTKDWSGPLYGGFEQVIDSYKRLESPRRLKEVNIYYHFYSAANPSALRALARIHDWCAEQPLHSVTAAEAARIHRGAINARVSRAGSNAWVLEGGEHLRTYRLPESAGVPDLAASFGITGWDIFGDWRYMHTDGREKVILVLAEEAPEHLFLQHSTADIHFASLGQHTARFRCQDLRDIDLAFGGLPPSCEMTLSPPDGGELPEIHRANEEGVITLRIPGSYSGYWEFERLYATADRGGSL